MSALVFVLVFLATSLPANILTLHEDNPLTVILREKPYRLNKIESQLAATTVELETENLDPSFQAVVITNEAEDWFRIFCSSEFDLVFDNERMDLGRSVLFEFEPVPSDEKIIFQCGLDYKRFYAIWDVYNVMLPYHDQKEQVHHYFVRHDGIYANGRKIHGLLSFETRYVLCNDKYGESRDCLHGYVDSNMCNNLPSWILNHVSFAEVTKFGCVILYDGYNCLGNSTEVKYRPQYSFLDDFQNKAVSVKGCPT